jgi:hypothetical protein
MWNVRPTSERKSHQEQTGGEQLHRGGPERGHLAADPIEPGAAGQPVQRQSHRKNALANAPSMKPEAASVAAAESRRRPSARGRGPRRQEDHEQIGGRRHQHHAGEQHERVVLAARQPLTVDGRGGQRQDGIR